MSLTRRCSPGSSSRGRSKNGQRFRCPFSFQRAPRDKLQAAPVFPIKDGSDRSESNMAQDELKQAVAREAIKYVVNDDIVGVGTGSTANCFIDELAKIKHRIKGAVASSVKTADRLKGRGIF